MSSSSGNEMSSIPKPVRTHDACPRKNSTGISQAIKANGLVFVSGQIPADKTGAIISGTIEEQTEAVFANLSAVLKASNSSFNKVVKVNVFLSDMANFARMNSVYAKYFSGHKPARSCVAVRELPLKVDVEIECIALEDNTPGKRSAVAAQAERENEDDD
ncbi:Endoribonuclease L-PSP-domain-containing protein [Tricharina praecox]|uniref:Endoribonuclease L-PSP-domain-containing protein n=1 Tax=Tricharina praecox TaxID=43433 RepID=UPI00221E9271|nr:Endoribonuclease L-PSP-domain-containing protein [Tricharina praecox]KAI5844860.1 Endoribonuclease L-PSP-domain-containing protein [Tricharina praecox]